MIKKNILFLLLMSCSVIIFAQQSAQYTSYMLDPVRYNSAYAGLDYGLSLTGTFRQQWAGLEGAPQSTRLSAHMPLYFLQGGIGIQVESESLGAHAFNAAQLDYNYQREIGSGVLSIGLGLGIHQFKLNGGQLITPDGQYLGPGMINHNDGLLSTASVSGTSIGLDAGLYYQSELFDIGFSIENTTAASVQLGDLNYQFVKTYHAFAATEFELGSSFVIRPSLWFRTDAIENQLDISVLTTYNDNIFGGVSLRGYDKSTRDALAVIVGFKLSETLTLAYAYDIALSPLQTVQSGSHEIVMKYQLDKTIGAGKLPRIIYHPRAKN